MLQFSSDLFDQLISNSSQHFFVRCIKRIMEIKALSWNLFHDQGTFSVDDTFSIISWTCYETTQLLAFCYFCFCCFIPARACLFFYLGNGLSFNTFHFNSIYFTPTSFTDGLFVKQTHFTRSWSSDQFIDFSMEISIQILHFSNCLLSSFSPGKFCFCKSFIQICHCIVKRLFPCEVSNSYDVICICSKFVLYFKRQPWPFCFGAEVLIIVVDWSYQILQFIFPFSKIAPFNIIISYCISKAHPCLVRICIILRKCCARNNLQFICTCRCQLFCRCRCLYRSCSCTRHRFRQNLHFSFNLSSINNSCLFTSKHFSWRFRSEERRVGKECRSRW